MGCIQSIQMQAWRCGKLTFWKSLSDTSWPVQVASAFALFSGRASQMLICKGVDHIKFELIDFLTCNFNTSSLRSNIQGLAVGTADQPMPLTRFITSYLSLEAIPPCEQSTQSSNPKFVPQRIREEENGLLSSDDHHRFRAPPPGISCPRGGGIYCRTSESKHIRLHKDNTMKEHLCP